MGCDIHVMIERKIKSEHVNEQWATVATLNVIHPDGFHDAGFKNTLWYTVEGRNYAFFGDLTDGAVRSESDGFVHPLRGLPKDVSPLIMAEADWWGIDAHSHSWLYADEFLPVYLKHCTSDQIIAEYTEDRLNGEPVWVEMMTKFFNVSVPDESKPSDFRFVFWFDS